MDTGIASYRGIIERILTMRPRRNQSRETHHRGHRGHREEYFEASRRCNLLVLEPL